jgi:hypothetical protein
VPYSGVQLSWLFGREHTGKIKNVLIEKNYELFITVQSAISYRLRRLLRSFCVQYMYSESFVF